MDDTQYNLFSPWGRAQGSFAAPTHKKTRMLSGHPGLFVVR